MYLFQLAFRRLLDRPQRRRYLLLQFYFLLAALVQVVSIASIAPFIALLSEPALITTQPIVRWFYTAGEFTSPNSFALAFALLLMAAILIGNIVPALMGYLSWRFVRNLATEVQADVFRGFIYGDLSEKVRLNSSERINLVTQGVNRLLYNVVLPLMSLVSSGLIILVIAVGLLIYDPVVALVASAIVGGGYASIFKVAKRRLSHHGSIAWSSLATKQRLLAESLGGLKEVRLAGTEAIYENRLHDITARALRSEARVGLYGDIPRFALEAMSLCALLALGTFMLLRNDAWASIVAVLSVYAMAGYRLLPAAQAVFRAATTIRANLDVIADITRDVEAGRAVLRRPIAPLIAYEKQAAIVVEDVHFCYPGESADVLRGVSFTIPRAGITALVGKSGAGKSTMADLLLGLMKPSRGSITVDRISIHESVRSWQRSVALVSQSVFLTDDTIEANIVFGSSGPVDRERLIRAATMAHALEFIDGLPGQFDCPIGEAGGRLSGGQRQRIGIARALYNDADVIVMDEPTSALDSLSEREVLAAMNTLRQEKTIVLITHRLHSLRDADQIVVLEHGIVAGIGRYQELALNCHAFTSLLAA